jgi:hypothetical protein
MRPLILSGALLVLNIAFNLTTSKYGVNIPDALIIACWLIPILPLLYLLLTHPKATKHREWYVQRLKSRATSTVVLTAVGAIVLVVSLGSASYRTWRALSNPVPQASNNLVLGKQQSIAATTSVQSTAANQSQAALTLPPQQKAATRVPTGKQKVIQKKTKTATAIKPPVLAPASPPVHTERPTNSIVKNAGSVSGLTISGAEVAPQLGGNATIIEDLNRATKVTIENPRVYSTPDLSTHGAGSVISVGPGVARGMVNNVEVCGAYPVTFDGPASDVTLNKVRVNPPECNWYVFLFGARKHRADIEDFLSRWKSFMLQLWTTTNLPESETNENTGELDDIRQLLIQSASVSEAAFNAEIRHLDDPGLVPRFYYPGRVKPPSDHQ